MTTIEVAVTGGVAPIPIKVFIDNLENSDDIRFTRNRSFSESFNLPSGKYMITVSGMNPLDGQTKIDVLGNFSQGPLPSPTQTATQPFYSELFYIEI